MDAVKKNCFLFEEDGSLNFDGVVVMGGAIWMTLTVATDVAALSFDATEAIAHRMEYASIVAEILGDYGPGGTDLPPITPTPDTTPDAGSDYDRWAWLRRLFEMAVNYLSS